MATLREHIVSVVGGKAKKEGPPWLKIVIVAAILLLGMWLGRIATHSDIIQSLVARFGYAGIFVIAFISGFNLLVPIPAVAFVPVFLASGQDLTTIIVIIALGVTLADLIAFYIGRAGREISSVRRTKVMQRMERFRQRHYWWPIISMFCWACIAPLPNEVLAMPLGLMGYPVWHVIPPLLVGNLIFNSLAAFGIAALWGIF